MKFNDSKIKLIYFGKNRQYDKIPFILPNGMEIILKEEIKWLKIHSD